MYVRLPEGFGKFKIRNIELILAQHCESASQQQIFSENEETYVPVPIL